MFFDKMKADCCSRKPGCPHVGGPLPQGPQGPSCLPALGLPGSVETGGGSLPRGGAGEAGGHLGHLLSQEEGVTVSHPAALGNHLAGPLPPVAPASTCHPALQNSLPLPLLSLCWRKTESQEPLGRPPLLPPCTAWLLPPADRSPKRCVRVTLGPQTWLSGVTGPQVPHSPASRLLFQAGE